MMAPDPNDEILLGAFISKSDEDPIDITDEILTAEDHDLEATEQIAAMVAAMHTHDAVYARRLADLRHAAGTTQTGLAASMSKSQAAIAALETRTDIKVSTLERYITALGAHAELVVTFADQQRIIIPLADLTQAVA